MELENLLRDGAALIESNDDDATTGLNIDKITKALNEIIMNKDGSLDLATIVGNLSRNGLGDIVGSWLAAGNNLEINKDQIVDLLGEDKITKFANSLEINIESAKQALVDSLPKVVDMATSEEHSMIDQMVGGGGHALETLSKMFR
ncbi:protein of unknown function DUF937 [hydrothermal vent metagenome]|uniref:DUF937 domain-containing protein n=1 Tax=hydrothermal vent metagenome TaxID=652676 RepID=A0A1W1EC05_9ZZZZ